MQDKPDDAKRLKANLQGEVDSAALYRALAAAGVTYFAGRLIGAVLQ